MHLPQCLLLISPKSRHNGSEKTGFKSHETRDCVAETRVRPSQMLEKKESALAVRKQKAGDMNEERLAFTSLRVSGAQ
jgi:hypothetical protein